MSDESDSIGDNEIDPMENQNIIPLLPSYKRQSYVWGFFSPVPDHSDVFRCKVCSETFGNRTPILSRHLQTAHGITEVINPLMI